MDSAITYYARWAYKNTKNSSLERKLLINDWMEAADKAAKHALDLPITEITIHCQDYKSYIKINIDMLLHRGWDECTENRLNKVQQLHRDKRLPGHLTVQETVLFIYA